MYLILGKKYYLPLDNDQLKDINYFNEEVPLNSEILLEYAEKYSNFKEPFNLEENISLIMLIIP